MDVEYLETAVARGGERGRWGASSKKVSDGIDLFRLDENYFIPSTGIPPTRVLQSSHSLDSLPAM